jgi:hypothetical protein
MVTRVPAPAAGMRATPMGTIEPAQRRPPPPPEWRPSRKIGRQRRRPAVWAGWSTAAQAAVDERGPGAPPAVLPSCGALASSGSASSACRSRAQHGPLRGFMGTLPSQVLNTRSRRSSRSSGSRYNQPCRGGPRALRTGWRHGAGAGFTHTERAGNIKVALWQPAAEVDPKRTFGQNPRYDRSQRADGPQSEL